MKILMPVIDLTKIKDPTVYKFAEAISTNNRGGNRLRFHPPKNVNNEITYVWRMVAYKISPRKHHGSIPFLACFKLGDGMTFDTRTERCMELDKIVKNIIQCSHEG